jgi:hypothetical protein
MVKLVLNLKLINESKAIHEQMNKQWSSSTSNKKLNEQTFLSIEMASKTTSNQNQKWIKMNEKLKFEFSRLNTKEGTI